MRKTSWCGRRGKIWRVDVFKKVAVEIPFHVKDTREIRRAIRFPTIVAADQFQVQQLRSVNVSPDGKRVVYSALGHLYLRNLPSGTPQRLTKQTDHFEYFPRFSFDGKRVVYATWDDEKLGTIRTIELASNKQIIITADPGQYSEPAFSADGKQIAYVKSRGGYLTSPWYGFEAGVHVTAADGTGISRLITEEGRAPQFGTEEYADSLYVTRQNFTTEVDWTTSLTRIKLDKSEEQQVVRSEMATDFTVSPDGAWLAFRERYHTHVMPLPPTGRAFVVGKKSTALPVKSLSVNAGDYLHFSGDSATVHFALGDELFSRQINETFDFSSTAPTPPTPLTPPTPPTLSALPKSPAIGEQGLEIGFTQISDKPSATIVISNAKIITMKGDEVINDGRIVISANRIVAVGSAKDVPIPADATLIDARGKTIIPGLVDVHWHGGMGVQGIIPKQSWINYASLAFGVTTIHDPSNDTATIFTVAEMQRAGLVVGPRIYSTGTILYGARGTFAAEVNSLDDALTHLKRMKAAGANTVKSYNQPRRDQRQQVLEAARQTSMMVVPEGGSLFQHNMNMIIDGHTGIEHAIPVAHAYDDVKQLWSQTAVGYTPTLNVAYGGLDGEHYWYAKTDVWRHAILSKYVPRGILEPRAVRRPFAPDADYNVITVAKTATELQRIGVNVNIGAHGQREGLGSHWDIWMLAKGGMTPLEAIRSATLNGAKYLGMERDIGSIEVGKLADMIIINADVLANIEDTDKITHVMQNGRLYDVATMNETGATPKARKPFFFERGIGNTNSAAGSDAFSRISALGEMMGHDHSQCNH